MAKKMVINCGDCDARFVSEETLAAYETISINAGTLLVTPETRNLLNRYNVTLNCGDVLELEKDVRLSTINGNHQIKSGDAPEVKTCLMVNGSLEIGPGTAQVVKQYAGIIVNGNATYPESLSGSLSMLQVNGSVLCYPDEAIVLKRSAVIDRVFALRAKKKLYWSAKKMVMVDPQLDGAVLAAKGATFSAEEVILAESKVEQLIELIDEKAEIIIVPDGTSVIDDDLDFDEMTFKRYGRKLYINGDLKVLEDLDILDEIEYLNIRGDAEVIESMKDRLMAVLTEIEGNVKVVGKPKGRQMSDQMKVKISRWLLEQESEGLYITDCMKVVLDADIPAEMILQKLCIRDCMEVKCTSEQEAAVAAVSEDVMAIGGLENMLKDSLGGENGDGMGIGEMLKGAFGMAKDAVNTKYVNAGDYIL